MKTEPGAAGSLVALADPQRCSRREAMDQWRRLNKVLANRVYLGEAVHKGVTYPGEHAAIIDQRGWDKAHAVMAEPAHRTAAAGRKT